MVSSRTSVYILLNILVHTCLSIPPDSIRRAHNQFERRLLGNSTCKCGEREQGKLFKEFDQFSPAILGNWSRIYGGKDANPGDEKWMAMVTTKEGRLCSGSLINDRMVLTAGHCVMEGSTSNQVLPAAEFRIWLNRKSGPLEDANPGSELHYVTQVIPHPEFERRNLRYDAAILILEEEINFDVSLSRPICIPSSSDDFLDLPGRTDGIAFGYGRIDGGSQRELPTTLQQGSITYLSLSKCVSNLNKVLKALGNDFEFTVEDFDTNICSSAFSQKEVIFVFKGDSGGPVTVPDLQIGSSTKLIQMGVVSGGFVHLIPQAQMSDPSITYDDAMNFYADIYRILPFIESVGEDVNAKWCM